MAKIDRRILKSQAAIKQAVIELMSEKNFDAITIQDISDRANVHRATIYLHYTDKFDLLDKLIEEHIQNMKEINQYACDLEWDEANQVYFEYFERHYLFFSTMLASKGAPAFRARFLEFLVEEYQSELNMDDSRNRELDKTVMSSFMGSAFVGIVEWWILNEMPHPPSVMAKQVGVLLERIA
ncbi:TetR/AcrR family transcriptional regulator [Saccharibacillus qingshengii]|uniref:TetR/AcrR family transcriptional regulator n=1 Tax=Saccharibacillus qingshengii TaxID=1763540 RepID=UPI001551BEB9|nr:TetR/AcrR family transcriptional regulator [Saccharibacillus qingshengii]